MPNMLAHFGVQGMLTRTVMREAEFKWIFLGCLIPDVPWILQRLGRTLIPGLDPYDLRLYAIVLASFAACLLLGAALALVSSRPSRVFGVLALNAFLHLLLDACQIKWANGVHLLAPFSWELLNFGWFWPESLPTLLLTVFGLGYVAWAWWHAEPQPAPHPRWSPRLCLLALGFLAAYILMGMVFQSGPYARDNHSVQTLREHHRRTGRAVEFDRNLYLQGPTGDTLHTFAGEELHVTGKQLGHAATVSVRGTFDNPTTIHIKRLHAHWDLLRDLASYLGLAILAGFWLKPYWQHLRA